MSDPCEEIADALVEFVGDLTTLSLQAVVEKPNDISSELIREDADLHVYFVPASETAEKIGRGGQCLETFTVNMVIVRRLTPDFTRSRLGQYHRELCLAIRGERMAGYAWSKQETVAKFDPTILHEHNQFTSQTQLTYVGTG